MQLKKYASYIFPWVGTLLLLGVVPWHEFFLTTVPSGGDNPAHPYLMMSVRDAFAFHGSIVHYATGFWNGFEMFQFYFPLPYLVFGLFSFVIHPSIAFKLMVLLPILLLPWSFARLARSLNTSIWIQLLMSCLAGCFLFTEAHVMWGGNIFSLEAGMIGNQWAFFFFVWSFALSFEVQRENKIYLPLILTSVATCISHFYALLMLFAMALSFFLCSSKKLFTQKFQLKDWTFYFNFILAITLIGWWIVPLMYYRPWSSNFGDAWGITLLKTVTSKEMTLFTLGLISLFIGLIVKRFRFISAVLLLFFLCNLSYFFIGKYLGVQVFLDVRIWPSLYFSLFLTLMGIAYLVEIGMPPWLRWTPLIMVFILFPSSASIDKAKFWFSWNWAGIESKQGWADFKPILDILAKKDRPRIITEMSDPLDKYLGSVRSFELLPYLIPGAEIPIGGIVNSAAFSHVGYALQCMIGDGCAGMPPGVSVSDIDGPRAVQYMRRMGVNYLIVFNKLSRDLFNAQPDLENVYENSHYILFKLKNETSAVDVFDTALPEICSERFLTLAVNMHRWDILRNTAFIYSNHCSEEEKKTSVNSSEFFNFLVDHWNTSETTMDRGWQSRDDKKKTGLHGYLFSYRSPIASGEYKENLFEPVVGYRNFDSILATASISHLNSEVLLPVQKDPPGKVSFQIYLNGYTAYLDGKLLTTNEIRDIEISQNEFVFKPLPNVITRTIDVVTADPTVKSKLPGNSWSGSLPKIDDTCKAKLDVGFNEMNLTTSCPGKPHVIKYSYYPKWQANVPINIGPNGFMVVTPKDQVTHLEHKAIWIDWIGYLLTDLGIIICFVLLFPRRRDT